MSYIKDTCISTGIKSTACISDSIKSTACIPVFLEFNNFEGFHVGSERGGIDFNAGTETGKIKVEI